jgi:hypothetical protein
MRKREQRGISIRFPADANCAAILSRMKQKCPPSAREFFCSTFSASLYPTTSQPDILLVLFPRYPWTRGMIRDQIFTEYHYPYAV